LPSKWLSLEKRRKMNTKLIISADDFGCNSNINVAISDSFNRNLCTNTSLIVNMPLTEEAVEIAYRNKFEHKVGLHINLTEGRPLTDSIRRLNLFCDEEGNFNAAFHTNTLTRLYLNTKIIGIIREEINEQLEKYIKYKFELLHLDSHHHIHTDYAIFKAIKPLIKKYNVKSMRISRNLYNKNTLYNSIYKLIFNNYIIKPSVYTTDYFGSIDDLLNLSKDKIKVKERDVVELMIHPIYEGDTVVDANIELARKISNLNKKFELISYADITGVSRGSKEFGIDVYNLD